MLPLAGPAAIAGVIARLPDQVAQFLRWSEVIASRPNAMTPLPPELDEVVRGDPETRYVSGYYDLSAGQALQITLPAMPCRYWMIQALNHWLEPIPGAHFNCATAQPAPDGSTRFTVSPIRHAGHWLDTAGRTRGALFFRTIGAATAVSPAVDLIEGIG